MNHVDRVEKYFSNNFNCSQAVFTTFATEEGLDDEINISRVNLHDLYLV